MNEPKLRRCNVEIKAKLPNRHAAIASLQRLDAKFVGTLAQTDTYFTVPHGRLKLRDIEGQESELIHYHRQDVAEAKTSEYCLIRLTGPDEVKIVLTAALGVRAVVRKRRGLWLWKNVRIHIDQVERLSDFIELESVVGPDFDLTRAQANLDRVSETLGIDPADHLAGSYLDLLMA